MSNLIIPAGYNSVLSTYETQTAIGRLKRMFEDNLSAALNLKRVSAPLFLEARTGLNDDLDGKQRPVEFEIKEIDGKAEVPHSLAKWKRMALKKYNFPMGEGLYTDMNAIRRDEQIDNLHSVYVDQWDWEKVIALSDRTVGRLKETVKKIVNVMFETQKELKSLFPQLTYSIVKDVSFITAQELEDLFPSLSEKERETEYLKKHKTAFIMQIGDVLNSGNKHDDRAPDYDDWKLNGDLIVWNDVLGQAVEISSMGIRVDQEALAEQLSKAGCNHRRSLRFHKALLAGELPLTIGGGIGQSRLCMLLLQKAHIGEVQVSIWDRATLDGCSEAGIEIL